MLTHIKLAEKCKKVYKRNTHSVGEIEYSYDKRNNLLAFRGTEYSTFQDLRDVLRDLSILPYKHKGYKGHFGFLHGAEQVFKDIKRDLHPSKPITLTGHSLGGAIATALALILLTEGYQIKEIVTFGSPRVFYQKVPELLPYITLYRNAGDIITFLPWGRHVTKVSTLGKKKLKTCITHHSIKEYIKALRDI